MQITSNASPQRAIESLPGQSGQRFDPQSANSSARPGENSGQGTVSDQDNRQSALKMVEQTLAMGYEKLSAQQRSAAGDFAQFEPLTADKVAGNILGFIEQRLQKDAADGATQEELEQRLEQGLAGFEKGFAQAREQLEALSMLTPEVGEDIGRTRDLVLEGIDQLRQRLLEGQLEQAPVEPEASAEQGNGPLAASAYEQARATSFSFELTTAEGDRVSIEAQASSGASDRADALGESRSVASDAATSWSVQGELSDAERAAIEDLVSQVDDLAEQFFAGDLSGALESAQALGYDNEQIVDFSLNLQQVDIQRVSETYNAASGGGMPASQGLQEQLAPLGEFARGLDQARAEAAQVSAEPERLLTSLAEGVASGDNGADSTDSEQSLNEFMQQILAGLSASNPAS